MKEKEEVLIIGAGLSGLVVAYQLQKFKVPYTIIEARERIGGRIQTIRTSAGAPIEMGATWFADKHIHLMKLIEELGISYEQQYIGNRAIYDYHNSRRTIEEISLPNSNEVSYIFSDGSAALLDALSSRLPIGKLHTGEPVKSLSFQAGKWKVQTSQREFVAGCVINTLPPNLFVNKIKLTPELPKETIDLYKATHTWMGESIKVGVEYQEGFWRGREVGTIFSQYGPIVELHDHIHSSSKDAVLMGFIDPHFSRLSAEERKASSKEQLSLYFKQSEALLKAYYEKDWQKDEFTFHPYLGSVLPHQNNGHPELRKPHFDGHLLFAGSETASSFPGYMDGAVERGIEVAEEIKSLLAERLQSS